MLLRNYKFRLYPTKSVLVELGRTLDLCRGLYNCALEERIWTWENRHHSLSHYDQNKELPELKQTCPEYKDVYAQILQNVLGTLDKTFKNFFRRIKASANKPGFPRFKSRDRYKSFTYPQTGFKIDESAQRVHLSKIGSIKLKAWRTLPSSPKRVTLKREADGWYAIFCCELEPVPLPKTGKKIGLDVGLKSLVTTSEGVALGSLSALKQTELELRKAQHELSRKKRGSQRRLRCKEQLCRKHQKLARRRTHQLHNLSRKLIQENDVIALEDLAIQQMAGSAPALLSKKSTKGLHRNIHQAAWGILRHQLLYKAEEAGRQVVLVNPKGTTQECSRCGEIVPKTLADRVHACQCGLVLDRDHNAAINILQRALQVLRGDLGSKAKSAKREDRLRKLKAPAGA